jgi:hypothetical protein
MKIFRLYALFVLFLFQTNLKANSLPNSFNSILFSVENSLERSDLIEVLALTSPKVLYLNSKNKEALSAARLALQTRSTVTIVLDDDSNLISKITLIDDSSLTNSRKATRRWAPGLYSPSVLSSYNLTTQLFNSVDSYTDSDLSDDCYNRAHYWARTFEVENNIKSMKVFVLFTPLYRKENNFNWWYHVAPYVTIRGAEGEERIVLDPSYEQSPQAMRDWVFHFASKANTCRIAKSLYQYQQEAAQGGCVVITASMYHYSPQDLDPENPPVGWRCEDLKAVQKALRAPGPYSNWENYRNFLPDHCY